MTVCTGVPVLLTQRQNVGCGAVHNCLERHFSSCIQDDNHHVSDDRHHGNGDGDHHDIVRDNDDDGAGDDRLQFLRMSSS